MATPAICPKCGPLPSRDVIPRDTVDATTVLAEPVCANCDSVVNAGA